MAAGSREAIFPSRRTNWPTLRSPGETRRPARTTSASSVRAALTRSEPLAIDSCKGQLSITETMVPRIAVSSIFFHQCKGGTVSDPESKCSQPEVCRESSRRFSRCSEESKNTRPSIHDSSFQAHTVEDRLRYSGGAVGDNLYRHERRADGSGNAKQDCRSCPAKKSPSSTVCQRRRASLADG